MGTPGFFEPAIGPVQFPPGVDLWRPGRFFSSVPDRGRRYRDPLDHVWRVTLERLGFRVGRSSQVYAHADGRGTLWLGTGETLDPDDCLAQMILHEICHALVQGPDSHGLSDWGLDNTSDRDSGRERACLRLQAKLTEAHGLRNVLAPTTDFRPFYDALTDPWSGDPEEVALAKAGYDRSRLPPYAPHLYDALRATRAIVDALRPFGAQLEGDDLPHLLAVP